MQQRAAREAVLQEQRAKADTLGAANRALLAQQFGHRDASLPAGLLPQQGSSAELQGLQTSGGEESRDALQGSSEGGESLSQGGVQGEGSAVGSSSVKIGAAEVVQQLREVAMAPSVHAMLDHMLPRQEAHDKLKASLASVQAEVRVCVSAFMTVYFCEMCFTSMWLDSWCDPRSTLYSSQIGEVCVLQTLLLPVLTQTHCAGSQISRRSEGSPNGPARNPGRPQVMQHTGALRCGPSSVDSSCAEG